MQAQKVMFKKMLKASGEDYVYLRRKGTASRCVSVAATSSNGNGWSVRQYSTM